MRRREGTRTCTPPTPSSSPIGEPTPSPHRLDTPCKSEKPPSTFGCPQMLLLLTPFPPRIHAGSRWVRICTVRTRRCIPTATSGAHTRARRTCGRRTLRSTRRMKITRGRERRCSRRYSERAPWPWKLRRMTAAVMRVRKRMTRCARCAWVGRAAATGRTKATGRTNKTGRTI